MGFIRVGFVEMAVEHFGLFFVAKKVEAQRFIIDARASNRVFLNPPSGPLRTGCPFESQERMRTNRIGLWIRPIFRVRFI